MQTFFLTGFRPELVSCPSPHSPYQRLGCTFLQIIPGPRKGPKLEDLAFIYILTGLCFSCSFFPLQEQRARWNFKRPQRNREGIVQATKSWSEHPAGIHRLPCGCNVFVRPSPLITIMSLERSMREEFMCVYVCLEKCAWEGLQKKEILVELHLLPRWSEKEQLYIQTDTSQLPVGNEADDNEISEPKTVVASCKSKAMSWKTVHRSIVTRKSTEKDNYLWVLAQYMLWLFPLFIETYGLMQLRGKILLFLLIKI